MPEGPEIRRAADRLERALVGAPVEKVAFAFAHLAPFQPRLRGRQVCAVETCGKAMLIHFDNGLSIYSHNQLYGKWFVRKAGSLPRTGRQLRLALHNARYSALLYSASDIDVLDARGIARHPFLAGLGPDALDAAPGLVLERLQSNAFRRRRLGSLYLDQGFVAGIGNYLRSEILFLAGLDPARRPVDCDAAALARLADLTRRVTRQSYRHNGVTNDLDEARRLRAAGQGRRRYRHWVFDRGGEPCRICGDTVRQRPAAGRRLYFCPSCQQ
jgi:endonuclease-8